MEKGMQIELMPDELRILCVLTEHIIKRPDVLKTALDGYGDDISTF